MNVCWCNMCGYTAKIPDSELGNFDQDQEPCPICKEEEQGTFLNCGDKFPDYVAEDEPLLEWKKK